MTLHRTLFIFSLSLMIAIPAWGGLEDDLYEAAVKSSPLVADLDQKSKALFDQQRRELLRLHEQMVSLYAGDEGPTSDALFNAVQARLQAQDAEWGVFSDAVKAKAATDPGSVSFPLSTIKMKDYTTQALQISFDQLTELLEGASPDGFRYVLEGLNVAGNRDTIYASGRGGALKLFLLSCASVMSGKPELDFLSHLFGPTWADENSTFVHPVTHPLDSVPDALAGYVRGNKLYSIHNGYFFGGGRDESSKPWFLQPQDCSSFVSHAIGCKSIFSTVHQVLQNHAFNPTPFAVFGESVVKAWEEQVLPNWQQDPFREDMDQVLEPLIVQRDPSRLVPGMIHAERAYKAPDQYASLTDFCHGSGGHTGVLIGVLGQGPDARALTLGANRDIQDITSLQGDFPYGGREAIFGLEQRQLFGDVQDGRMIFYASVEGGRS